MSKPKKMITKKHLTLRQFYAGMAMNGWLVHLVHLVDAKPEDIADFAFTLADAMIEREKK